MVTRLRAAGCVFAEDEAALLIAAARTPVDLDRLVERRCGGEPLEYILGWVEFCGRRILLDPGVFVPRRRTEFLAEAAIRAVQLVRMNSAERGPVIAVELCCGAGAVGAALLAAGGDVDLCAADIDPGAVRCARRNLPGTPVLTGDLFEALPQALRRRIDVVVANVPCVPTAEIDRMPPEARDHEPRRTLDGGVDGLAVARRLAAEVRRWLAPGGSVLIETSDRQAPAAAAIFTAAGLAATVLEDPERGAVVVTGVYGA